MKIPVFCKVLLCVTLVAIILFLSFWSALFMALANHLFMSWVIIIAAVALIVLIPVTIFKKFIKPVKTVWFILLAGTVLPAGVYTGINVYDSSIPVIYERSYAAAVTEPFTDSVARLGEPSLLRLEDNPPRLNSATALCPVQAAFVTAVYPETFAGNTQCGGTRDAYDSLINGRADIIFVARPSAQQTEAAEKAGVHMILR